MINFYFIISIAVDTSLMVYAFYNRRLIRTKSYFKNLRRVLGRDSKEVKQLETETRYLKNATMDVMLISAIMRITISLINKYDIIIIIFFAMATMAFAMGFLAIYARLKELEKLSKAAESLPSKTQI